MSTWPFATNGAEPVLGDLDQSAAGEGPAGRHLDTGAYSVCRDQPIVIGVTIELQDATPCGAVPPYGRSSRAKAPRYPVLVFPAPRSKVGAQVSSTNSFVDRFRSAITATTIGRKPKAARPTQSAGGAQPFRHVYADAVQATPKTPFVAVNSPEFTTICCRQRMSAYRP